MYNIDLDVYIFICPTHTHTHTQTQTQTDQALKFCRDASFDEFCAMLDHMLHNFGSTFSIEAAQRNRTHHHRRVVVELRQEPCTRGDGR